MQYKHTTTMSLENEKAITNRARHLYGTQGEFCMLNGFVECNFSSLKKRRIENLEEITEPLGLEIVLKKKEGFKRPNLISNETPV